MEVSIPETVTAHAPAFIFDLPIPETVYYGIINDNIRSHCLLQKVQIGGNGS